VHDDEMAHKGERERETLWGVRSTVPLGTGPITISHAHTLASKILRAPRLASREKVAEPIKERAT